MLSSLSCFQHVLIKAEKLGLGSWACPFGFAEFIVLLVSVLKHLGGVSARSTEPGTEQVLSKHLTEPSGSDETLADLRRLPPGKRDFTPPRQAVDLLAEWGRATKNEPCFHLMCFMCMPGGLHRMRNTSMFDKPFLGQECLSYTVPSPDKFGAFPPTVSPIATWLCEQEGRKILHWKYFGNCNLKHF